MLQPVALCSVRETISMDRNALSPVTMDTQWQVLPVEFARRIQLHLLVSGQGMRHNVNVRNALISYEVVS